MTESEGVVTPEAVVLQFRPAGLGSRLAAYALDVAIFGSVLAAIYIAGAVIYFNTSFLPAWIGITLLTILSFVVLIGYPVLWETLWNGRTPGKAALGLRVLTEDGSPIRFRHALIRAFVGVFEIFATGGFIAALVLFMGGRGRRIGDLTAGTVVRRERSAQNLPRSFVFKAPSGAGEYTATLDVSMLTAADYVTIRSFLVRAPTFDRDARVRLAGELGSQFIRRVRSRPPSWLTAEGFLLCLAAPYQRRFTSSTPGPQGFGSTT